MLDSAQSPDVLICGAGIAGISTAYHLAVQQGIRNVILIDERAPMSLTSDKSTECYRNWWPGPGDAMVQLMNRSIDWLERLADESGNIFHLNRRGYLYLTGRPEAIQEMRAAAQAISELGAGPLRIHHGRSNDPPYIPAGEAGYPNKPSGADLLLDPKQIHTRFPGLSPSICAGLHVRRAGWFSAQQLGAYLLDNARQHGVQLVNGKVVAIDRRRERITAVTLENGLRYTPGSFVNAAGPFLGAVGELMGLELPVYTELHLKAAFHDHLGVIPRHSPLLIWNDHQRLPWAEDEREDLASDPEMRWLVEKMPPGAHTRPEGESGSDIALMLWEYRQKKISPVWPPPLDELYPEVALRGLVAMLPGLSAYLDRLPQPTIDGGYYTKTPDNRPLIGVTPLQNGYLVGALSGYGLMASCAVGELTADYISDKQRPKYASAFGLERFDDPSYLAWVKTWDDAGQL